MAKLKARKMIYVVNASGYRTLTEEIDIELHDIGGGCEGGDFDELEVVFNNHQKVLNELSVGDKIEVHCFNKNKGKKEWFNMFDPIVFNVIQKNEEKTFELDSYTVGGSWCYDVCVDYA